MKRFMRWMMTVILVTVVGVALGTWFGALLYELSHDYAVVNADYSGLGLRFGVFGGSVLGAVQTLGVRTMPRMRQAFYAIGILGVVAMGITSIAGPVCLMLYSTGVLDSSSWVLSNPRRHALFMGFDLGVRIGAMVGLSVAAAWLWRRRFEAGESGGWRPAELTESADEDSPIRGKVRHRR